MKKLLLSLAAVAMVGTAMPAAAQTWTYSRVVYTQNFLSLNQRINLRQANLLERVDNARAQRRITAVEAQRLRADLRRVEAVERQYRRRGLNKAEFASLSAGLNAVQVRLDQKLQRRYW